MELMVSRGELFAGSDLVAHVDSAVRLANKGGHIAVVDLLKQAKRNHPKNFG